MLPLRLGIVTAAAALCLWGLFSLLDSLREPGLLRSSKAIVVKGCESLQNEPARQQCPALFCEKALLDAKLLPLQAQFQIDLDRALEDRQHLILGRSQSATGQSVYFMCEMAELKVTDARLVERDEFDELGTPGNDAG